MDLNVTLRFTQHNLIFKRQNCRHVNSPQFAAATMLNLKKLLKPPLIRALSDKPSLEHLKTRSLIRISGPEVSNFIQGLITNDISHLGGAPCMYTMFLNNQGRVLYDSIFYKPKETDTFLIECDSEVSPQLQRHLKMYRVRRKIDIASLEDEYRIYVTPTCDNLNQEDILIYRDPRISQLGYRILAKRNFEADSEGGYRYLRYSLGVGEGVQDLPPGNCFPLECNCDYLHGVSFHKGCYVGQELTARVHHTGVIRKRLMPLFFKNIPKKPADSIVHEKQNLGKFRGIERDVGLGLLRFSKALAFEQFQVGDGVASTQRPPWWPLEAPKERLNVNL